MATYSSLVSMVISMGLQAIAGGSVEALFCLSYMVQIVTLMPAMNLYFPSNVIVMFDSLAFVNLGNPTLAQIFT